jgi:hypothetical protein
MEAQKATDDTLYEARIQVEIQMRMFFSFSVSVDLSLSFQPSDFS